MHAAALVPAFVVLVICTRHCEAGSIDIHVRDAAGKPVADAVVYALPAAGVPESRAPRPVAAIEQVDREFVPYVSVIQAGTRVSFPNRDPIQHHVYSFSPVKRFEIKLYSGRSPEEILFDKPGVVTIGCNIHDWMIGYIFVAPTPYFAKVDAAGDARLPDLRAGGYEVHVWHPRQRATVAPVSLSLDSASAAVSASFNVDVAPRKPTYKPPLDRMKY